MKNLKKKTLLAISLTALFGTMVVGELTPIAGSIINAKAEDIPDNFAKLDTVDWFSVDAFAYPAYDEEEHIGYASDPDGRADLELYFSPIFADYNTFNEETLSTFMDPDVGLIGAIKYILASQVRFIQPVEPGTPREVDSAFIDAWNDSSSKEDIYKPSFNDGKTIFSEFVDAVIATINEDETAEFSEEYNDYLETMSKEGEAYREILESIEKNQNDDATFNDIMIFLRQILAYAAGTSVSGSDDASTIKEELAARLGITNGEADISSGLGQALKAIYLVAEAANYDALIKNDILQIYSDACEIVDGESQALALIEAFVLLEKTEIPMKVITDIIGDETIKDAVIEIFTNDEISVEIARFLLENFSKDTVYTLCENVSFTKDEIKDAIEEIDPKRLMEIAKDLSPEAMDIIRIILGMANDNIDDNPKAFRKTRAEKEHYQYPDQYNEFGNDLVNIVLGNMDLMDMIDAVEAVWVGDVSKPVEERLVYSYNYTPENGESRDGRRLYLHNLIDWINSDLPTMSDIKNRSNAEQHETIHIEVKTPLNEENIYCDLSIGFMPNKNCDDLRRLAKNLDDVFDLTFDFVEGKDGENPDYSKNTLDYDLTIRPQYLTNLLEFVFNDNVLINDDDLRLKEHLFDLMFGKTFGEMKTYYNQNLAEQILKDLKHVNYETISSTLLTFNSFKNLFKNTSYTEADITKFISNLKWMMGKFGNLKFDDLKEAIVDLLGNKFGDKINDQDFKNLVNDIYAWCNETDVSNISIDVLKSKTNIEMYGFVDLLNTDAKKGVLNRIGNLIFKIINAIPDELDNYKIMDFYSNGKLEITQDSYLLDWKEILAPLPLGNKLYALFNAMIAAEDDLVLGDAHILIDGNVALNEGSASAHSVTYKYIEDNNEVKLVGMLPEGATLLDFAKDLIDGKEVDHWVIAEGENAGEILLTMPDYDVILSPVFKENKPSIVYIFFILPLLNAIILIIWMIVSSSQEKEEKAKQEAKKACKTGVNVKTKTN